MKKLKLITALAAVCMASCTIVGLTACEEAEPPHTHSYTATTTGNTFQNVCTCGDVQSGFFVKLIYQEDGSEADAGISVVWTDKTTGEQVTYGDTNEFGEVSKTQLSGNEYGLYLYEDSLPEFNGVKYSYDKLTYNSIQNGVGLIIPLYPVYKPSNVNDAGITGRLTTTEDKFAISLEKQYVATLNSATDALWYVVQNEGVGKYTVSVNTTADVNVKIERYHASSAYVPEFPDSKADSATKNKLTYTVVHSDGNQNSTIKIMAPEEDAYPISIPFSVSITFKAEYTVAKEEMVKPTHFNTVKTTYSYVVENDRVGTQTVELDSLAPVEGVQKYPDVANSMLTDLSASAIDGLTLKADGYYYTSEGLLVHAKINAPSIFESYTLATTVQVGNNAIFMVNEYNLEYEYATKRSNYFGMVMAYNALCNADGVYPLTEEMFTFLKAVATKEHRGVNELLAYYPV